jgi:hypothetical protein
VTVAGGALNGQDDDGVVPPIQAAIDAQLRRRPGPACPPTSATATITMTALNADVDFVINANATTDEIGLTVDAVTDRTVNSTSLLDNIGSSGQTLTVQVNGGANQVITFGTGPGEVSTLAELNTKLTALSGVTGTADNSAVAFNIASTTSAQNSLTLTASAAGHRARHHQRHHPGHRQTSARPTRPAPAWSRTTTTCCPRSTRW